MKRWGSLLLAAAAVGAYLLLGAPQASAGATCAGTPDATVIANGSTSWSPSSVTIPANDVVCWLNNSGIRHIISSNTGAFADHDLPAAGSSFEFTFSTPGTYPFHCAIHANMIGTVFVPPVTVDAATTPASGSNDTNPTVTGTGPPNTQIDIYEGSPCATLIDNVTSNGSGVWSYPVSEANSITSGSTVSFSARAVSPTNGIFSACSASSTSYTAGTTGPSIDFQSGPADTAIIPSRTPTWTFSSTDTNPVTFGCSADKGSHSFNDCSGGTFTPTVSADGLWSLAIQATDTVTSDERLVVRAFTVDTANPKIKGPSQTRARRPVFKLSGDANFSQFTYECSFNNGKSYFAATIGTNGPFCQPPSRLRPGKHVVRSHAVDTTDTLIGPDHKKAFTILS